MPDASPARKAEGICVEARGEESIGALLRRFRLKFARAGLFHDLKAKRFAQTRAQRKRHKRRAAEQRRRRKRAAYGSTERK